jgi:hypothetical protein
MLHLSSCCRTALKSRSDGLISSLWSTPAQSTKYCCICRSMNHPSLQAAVPSVCCASCQRVANVDPTALVRKCPHLYNMSVRGDQGAKQDLCDSCHVLDQSSKFVEISRGGETQLCHCLYVFVRETGGCVRRFELHLH